MSAELFIFAEIKPKPQHFTEAKEAILGIVDQTRAESGCRSFTLHEAPNENALYLMEEWQDQDALDRHHEQIYTVAVFKSYKEWLTEPPRIHPMHCVK